MSISGTTEATGLSPQVPLGKLGYAEVTADQGSITTEVDLTGLTVTVTVGSGRRIKVTGEAMMRNTNADAIQVFRLHEDGVQVQSRTLPKAAASADAAITLTWSGTPSAGSHTYKLRGWAVSGTSTLEAASTNPAFILVEDIGAA